MQGVNFVSFLTVGGFFIGIIFALLQSSTPEGFLGYVIVISSVFYMFAHLCVGLFFQTLEAKSQSFAKKTHEHNLDFFVREINKREQFIDAFYNHRSELLEDSERSAA